MHGGGYDLGLTGDCIVGMATHEGDSGLFWGEDRVLFRLHQILHPVAY